MKVSACAHLLQVEDGSRDALHSVHRVLRVRGLLALHHHVFVQVHLPLDRRVIGLQHKNNQIIN